MLSLPTRERGLKFSDICKLQNGGFVAPYAGAWIEILPLLSLRHDYTSLPTRERGLKYLTKLMKFSEISRSLRGSVD